MKLTVLVDNNTYIDKYFYGEPAVSYYIEDEGTNFLFDVAYSDLFLKNANKLNINLDNLDKIVISHGHNDHTFGLKYYFEKYHEKIDIISHPDTFKEKTLDTLQIGSPILEKELNKKANLILSKTPIKVSKNITFLGEIPQYNDFEIREAIGKKRENNDFIDDYNIDDSAIFYQSKDGIYIITGCSHSGICNIIEHAKKVSNDNRVLGVIGGFHLFENNSRSDKTIDYFEKNNIKRLYPCHCTSFLVRAEIHKRMAVNEVGVSLELNF